MEDSGRTESTRGAAERPLDGAAADPLRVDAPRAPLRRRLRFQWQTLGRWVNLHVRSRFGSPRDRTDTASVRTFLLFLGYSRSGSTLLASLLNAHPEVAIAHELDVCWYVRRGITRERLFALLIARHRWFAERGWKWTGYSYEVPGAHQGRYTRLTVLGDKRARGTNVVLGERPETIDDLRVLVGVPLRFIHQVRNPFDNITTEARRNALPLAVAADRYFTLAENVERIRGRLHDDELLHTRLEDVIARPRPELTRCFEFLGVEVDDALLAAAADAVFASPRRTRDSVDWPPALIDSVRQRMARHDWLRGYDW